MAILSVALAFGRLAAADQAQRLIDASQELAADGQLREARDMLEEARTRTTSSVGTIDYLLGVVDFRLGRCRQAIAEFETFARLSPNDPRSASAAALQIRCRRRPGRDLLISGGVFAAVGAAQLAAGSVVAERWSLFPGIAVAVLGGTLLIAGVTMAIVGGARMGRYRLGVAPSLSSRGGGLVLGAIF